MSKYFQLQPFSRYALFALFDPILFYLSGCRYHLLEGKFNRFTHRYINWNRTISFPVNQFVLPRTIDDVIQHVKNSKKLRVVGAGHSFNCFIQSNQMLMSLERLNKVISFNKEKKEIRVQAGMRLRDLLNILIKHELSLPVTGAFAAQTIAGLIATNTHGTGKRNGFFSDAVQEITIVDGNGETRVLSRNSPLFQATIGGVGLTGVIVEAVIQCIDSFTYEYNVKIISKDELFSNLNELVQNHDHVHAQLFLSQKYETIVLETWDKVGVVPKQKYQIGKHVNTFLKSLSWIAIGYISPEQLYKFSGTIFKTQTALIPSQFAFVVPTFPPDLQFEQVIAYKDSFNYLNEFLELKNSKYYDFFVYAGVRFTPASSARPMLFPDNLGNRWTWLDPNCHPTETSKKLEKNVTDLTIKYNGFFHTGKAFDHIEPSYIKYIIGDKLKEFVKLCDETDPQKKFISPLAEKMFF